MGKSATLRFLGIALLVALVARVGVGHPPQVSTASVAARPPISAASVPRSTPTAAKAATTASLPTSKSTPSSPAATAAPTRPTTPVAVSPSSPHGRIGIYLGSYGIAQASLQNEVLARAKEGLLNAVVINVKDNHGEVTYASSVPLAKQIGAVTGRLDLRALIPLLKRNGIYVIARQVVFDDPKLAAYLKSAQAPWVAPADERAITYNLSIADEVASLGFDEIQFDYVRYPDGGSLTPVYGARYAAIDRFLERANALLSGRVYVSADLFGRVMWTWNEKRIDPIGQSLEDMAPHLDVISPMLYPSHYAEPVYKSDPYRTVKDALTTGKSRVGSSFRPYLQAFNMAIPSGMTLETYIRAQVRAAVEYGADGYLFWDPDCNYQALFRALEGSS